MNVHISAIVVPSESANSIRDERGEESVEVKQEEQNAKSCMSNLFAQPNERDSQNNGDNKFK